MGIALGTIVPGAPSGHAQAQGPEKKGMGALPDDPADYADWPEESLTRAYIPEAIDLTPMMPPVADQGKIGACVSYAVGYAVRGYYSALEQRTKPGTPNITLSPAYLHTNIYNQSLGCTSGGSSLTRAVNFLERSGGRDLLSAPHESICAPELAIPLPRNEFSIPGGRTIYVRGRNGARAGGRELDIMKQALAAGHPVAVGFDLFKAGPDEEDPTTLQVLDRNATYLGSLSRNYGPSGGHAMVFVGYDERRSAFRVQNSWGDDWADLGFGWIDYAATKADLNSAVRLNATLPVPVPVPARVKRLRNDFPGLGACTDIAEVPDSRHGSVLTGFVETPSELRFLQRVAKPAQLEDVAVRPWPVCEALLTLGEPLEAPSRPSIAIDGGRDRVKFGDVMGFSVTTPDFPSFLYVVYLQADGTVVNLVPRRGLMRKQTPPGTVLRFGDGRDGRQTFRVSAPEGPEAIIAIAARSPMDQLEALEAEGNGQFRLEASLRGDAGEANAQDRLWLSLLRTALAETLEPSMIAREVTADVAHVMVTAQ